MRCTWPRTRSSSMRTLSSSTTVLDLGFGARVGRLRARRQQRDSGQRPRGQHRSRTRASMAAILRRGDNARARRTMTTHDRSHACCSSTARATCTAPIMRCPTCAAPDGFPTGAIHGMVAMMRWLRERLPGRRMRPACSTPRARPFATTGTRSTRPTAPRCPTTWRCRSSRSTKWCELLGWPVLEVPGIEADDAIGTLALRARPRAATA